MRRWRLTGAAAGKRAEGIACKDAGWSPTRKSDDISIMDRASGDFPGREPGSPGWWR
ncbi:hypothetical protein TUM17576_17280 [Enterobacter hormaechei]|nr:hypothetical protein TUM17576_17280 [Enterobacter hormaechei]